MPTDTASSTVVVDAPLAQVLEISASLLDQFLGGKSKRPDVGARGVTRERIVGDKGVSAIRRLPQVTRGSTGCIGAVGGSTRSGLRSRRTEQLAVQDCEPRVR